MGRLLLSDVFTKDVLQSAWATLPRSLCLHMAHALRSLLGTDRVNFDRFGRPFGRDE